MVFSTRKRKNLRKFIKTTKKKKTPQYLQKGGGLIQDINKFIQEKINPNKIELNIISVRGDSFLMPLLDETVGSEADYKERTRDNLDIFNSLKLTQAILLAQIHSNYFATNKLTYFYLPTNSIVCFLSDLNFGSKDVKSGLLKYFRDPEQGPQLFEDVFKYRAKLIEEEFQFARDENPNSSISCYDVFKNSNWYYPGQLCPNSLISFSGYDISKKNDCYLYNIHKTSNTINISDFVDHKGETFKGFELKDLCYTNHTENKIFIINGCMILTNPDIQTNLLDIKKIKYYNTKMNLEVEKENFSTEEPLTNYYQYQCTTHLNYIFNYPFYSAQNLLSYYETQPEEIEIYDNRNRIVNEIIKKLNSQIQIEEKYIHFLQSLSFRELQVTIINILIHPSGIDPSQIQSKIIDRVFTEEYLASKTGVFRRYLYDFETRNYNHDIGKRALTYYQRKMDDILLLEGFFKKNEPREYHQKFHEMMATSLESPEIYFIYNLIRGTIGPPEKYKSLVFEKTNFNEFTYLEFPKFTHLRNITFKNCSLDRNVNNITIKSPRYNLTFEKCILDRRINFKNFHGVEKIELDTVKISNNIFTVNKKIPQLKNINFCNVNGGRLYYILFEYHKFLELIMVKDSDIKIINIFSCLTALRKLHLINLPNLNLRFQPVYLSNLEVLHLQQIKIPKPELQSLLNLHKLQRILLFDVSINTDTTYQLTQSQVRYIMIRNTNIKLDLSKVTRKFQIEYIQIDSKDTLIQPTDSWLLEQITFEYI
jgi:hypothetical protein